MKDSTPKAFEVKKNMLLQALVKKMTYLQYWGTFMVCAVLIFLYNLSITNDVLNYNQQLIHSKEAKELSKFANRSYEKNYILKAVRNLKPFYNDESFSRNIPVVIVLCQKVENQTKSSSEKLNSLYDNKFFRQTKVLLKSIAMATENVNRVVIVANKITPIQGVKKFINTWPIDFQRKLLLEYHTFTPRKECMDRKLFKLCASVRLFLHEILPDEDSIIYVDSDFIFLESPEKLARYFQNFNQLQFVGAAHNGGFYEFPTSFHYADYYYYGNTGISTGMLLMNLTRIKDLKFNWTETVYSVCRSYKGRLRLYDQGVYNIIFSEFEENLYELDCRWSYNTYYCHDRSICSDAMEHGNIFAVHGPSNTFFQDLSKKMKVLFQAFEKFTLGDSISELISYLKFALNEIEIIQPEDTDGCKNIAYLDKALLQPLLQKI